jgi:hypothetical protein
MPTATAADDAFGGVIERDQERSGFQLRNQFKRSRYAGPFQPYELLNSVRSCVGARPREGTEDDSRAIF